MNGEQIIPCAQCRTTTIHRPTPPDGRLRCRQCHPDLVAPTGQPHVQTIEQTGKDVKIWMLTGGAVFLLGLVILGSGHRVAGGVLAIGGGVGYFVAKLSGWWKHG